MKKFEVESYFSAFHKNDEMLEVVLKNGGKRAVAYIPKKKYEFWLLTSGKLLWSITRREAGVHRVEELEGTMTHKEYWSQDMPYIYDDIYEYIMTHPVVSRGNVFSEETRSISTILN